MADIFSFYVKTERIGDWRWFEIHEKRLYELHSYLDGLAKKNMQLILGCWRMSVRRVIPKSNDLAAPLPLHLSGQNGKIYFS